MTFYRVKGHPQAPRASGGGTGRSKGAKAEDGGQRADGGGQILDAGFSMLDSPPEGPGLCSEMLDAGLGR